MPTETNFTPRLGEIFEVHPSQVNLFRSINAPGFAIGDIAITAAGATYEWDGDSWNSISVGAGGGGAQTPWAQDIDGAGFNLANVGTVAAGSTIITGTLGVTGAASFLQTVGVTGGMVIGGILTIAQATANTGIIGSTGYSLTGSNATSMLDLAGTWNTSGNPVALKLAISNTASGATSKFISFLAGAAGATEKFYVDKDGTVVAVGSALFGANQFYLVGANAHFGNASLGFGASTGASGSDVFILRDAANTLALRNSTNAQTFNVYNTFTDASNYERLVFKFDTNIATIAVLKAGTGASRQFQIGSVNNAGIKLWTDETISFQTSALATRWQFNSSGHFLAGTDNTYDIGASGATRPRNIYSAGSIFSQAGGFVAANTSGFVFSSFGGLKASSDGVLALYDNASGSFSRLQFGGTTSSFPSLKRSTTGLICRLADDSADAPFSASTGTFSGNVAAGGNSYFTWAGKSLIGTPSDGVMVIANVGLTDFGRLQFGGTTSSFPSWKRSAAQLHCRLADDSADAVLQALQINVAGTQVLSARRTGWSAATGGATRTTYDTATVTLPQLAERVKALLDDALVHGFIGA